MPDEAVLDEGEAATPRAETARLEALRRYAILDTPRERDFDDIAALASEICGAPIAVVNLIDKDRQWFKAEVGLGVRETPLESSFCRHALLEQDMMVVPDATQDPRFDCNPLVVGPPGLRFYAGALLKTGAGVPIGTLCVLDMRPRSLSEQQIRALARLARQVMTQLELRRAMAESEVQAAALRELNARLEQRAIERAESLGHSWQVTQDLMGVLTPEGRLEAANPALRAMLGLSGEELAKTSIFTLIHPEDRARSQEAFAKAQRGEPMVSFENRYRSADGSYRWLSWMAVPADGKFHCTARDITAAVAQQAALAELMRERERTWRLSQDLLLVAGQDGRLSAVNGAWTTLLGWTEADLLGKAFVGIAHADDLDATQAAFAGMAPMIQPFEHRLRHKDGGYRWFAWTGAVEDGRIYGTGRDITARHEQAAALSAAEDALRQAQKMEAVGQLTGGVAHDFNNLLTIIRGSIDLLARPGLQEDRRRRYIEAISDTTTRAARLTGQLLAFARRQALLPEIFDASASVVSIGDMVRTLTGAGIALDILPAPEPCFLDADPNQFHTALINLVVNARDAMPGGGRLSIAVRAVSGVPGIRSHAPRNGPFVAVMLADDGEGIPADRLDRIFEPFFTTKAVGQGTGLGLSQVFGFVKQSGGEVHVESTPGIGSVFTLYLPRAAMPAHPAPPLAPAAAPLAGDGARVLLVEDNAMIGAFTTQTLTELGYRTVLVNDAAEALAALEEQGSRFDVVFTDVVMPGMNGVELGQEIRRRRPELPVVLTSGYSHILAEQGARGFPLLHKPYSLEQLSQALRNARPG